MEHVIFRVSDTLNKRERVKKEGETFVFTSSSSRFASPLASTTSKRGTLVVLVVVRRRRRSAFV